MSVDTVFASLLQFLIACLILAGAEAIYVLLGFGAGVVAVGLVSGVLTGLFGTGGPPLIFYYQLRGSDKAAFRGNLMAIFLLMTAFRLPSYAAFGLITEPRVWSSLALVPAAILGALAGDRIHLRTDEATFRRLVSAALVVIGVTLLARSL